MAPRSSARSAETDQSEERDARHSGQTVTVGCKLPHGLVLELCDMVDTDQAVAGGGFRVVKEARKRGRQVVIKGYLQEQKMSPVPLPSIAPKFVFTDNVDAVFFEEWLHQNADHEAVRNNLIFAHETDTRGKAVDYANVRTLVEPVDADKVTGKVTTYKKDDLA